MNLRSSQRSRGMKRNNQVLASHFFNSLDLPITEFLIIHMGIKKSGPVCAALWCASFLTQFTSWIEAETIFVHAVLHTARDPEEWQQRSWFPNCSTILEARRFFTRVTVMPWCSTTLRRSAIFIDFERWNDALLKECSTSNKWAAINMSHLTVWRRSNANTMTARSREANVMKLSERAAKAVIRLKEDNKRVVCFCFGACTNTEFK